MTGDHTMKSLQFTQLSPDEMKARADAFLQSVRTRRSIRHFTDAPIPLEVVALCIEAACTAPSGANKQPWTFVLVTNPGLKAAIRSGAEEEERAFYGGRASKRWLTDLEPFGTDADKPMLTDAPALIAVFGQRYGETKAALNYYVQESVGIAVGILVTALHHAGLASLVHTPSPMNFLGEILGRPKNERPFLLIPIGFPAADCRVPDIHRKPLDEVFVRR
jgi:iodotyrosine deiodinase